MYLSAGRRLSSGRHFWFLGVVYILFAFLGHTVGSLGGWMLLFGGDSRFSLFWTACFWGTAFICYFAAGVIARVFGFVGCFFYSPLGF